MAYDTFFLPNFSFRGRKKDPALPRKPMAFPHRGVVDVFSRLYSPVGGPTAQGQPEVDFLIWVVILLLFLGPKNSTSSKSLHFLDQSKFLLKANWWFLWPAESQGSPCNHLHIWIICTIPGFARDRKPNGWILWWIALMPETKKSWEMQVRSGSCWHVNIGSYTFQCSEISTEWAFLSFKEMESFKVLSSPKSSII